MQIVHKIFDLSYKNSTHIYSSKFLQNTNFLTQQEIREEISNNIVAINKNLGVEGLVILKQVHGSKVYHAIKPSLADDYEIADAVITTRKNLAIGVLTADCVPVLLYDDTFKSVIGAIHCGWRSSYSKIIDNVLEEVRKFTTGNIYAVIGPSIQQGSYEVDEDFYSNFIRDDTSNCTFFIKSANKWLFDLPGYVCYQLKKNNVTVAKHIKDDTYNMLIYPSYRRANKQGLTEYRRILSTIVIK